MERNQRHELRAITDEVAGWVNQANALTSRRAKIEHAANDAADALRRIRQPTGSYLAMPEVSSGGRTYIPAALLPASTIASNKLICWPSDDLRLFALLSSRVFTTWQDSGGGKLKSYYSLSPGLSYCTFPMPEDAPASRRRLETLAQTVLDARAAHPGATLAQLYAPMECRMTC